MFYRHEDSVESHHLSSGQLFAICPPLCTGIIPPGPHASFVVQTEGPYCATFILQYSQPGCHRTSALHLRHMCYNSHLFPSIRMVQHTVGASFRVDLSVLHYMCIKMAYGAATGFHFFSLTHASLVFEDNFLHWIWSQFFTEPSSVCLPKKNLFYNLDDCLNH